MLADVVDRDHVRVRGEAGGSPRLALETLACALILAEVGGQQFDRDIAVQQLVVRLPYAGHPAVGEMPDHAVAVGQGDAIRTDRGHRTHGTRRSASYTLRRDGSNLSLLRQAPGLWPEPLTLHGCHEASVRRQRPEGPDR